MSYLYSLLPHALDTRTPLNRAILLPRDVSPSVLVAILRGPE